MDASRLQMLLGIEGLALLRLWLNGDRRQIEARIADIARLVEGWESSELAAFFDVAEIGAAAGYDTKAGTYDDEPNPIIALEQQAVWRILDRVGPGRALDAACGTGRHARRLLHQGNAVIAVDAAPAMLDQARAKVPGADVRAGDLTSLPLDDDSVDLAVCALALTHLAELGPAIRELARVVRPGGRIVLSDVHPVFVSLGSQAYAVDDQQSRRRFIRNHVHLHSAYISAFVAGGLLLRGCCEPAFDDAAVALVSPSRLVSDAAATALLGLPAILVWELQTP